MFEGATQAFHWAPPPDAHGYQLWLGTTPGAHDLGFFYVSGHGIDGDLDHARRETSLLFRDFNDFPVLVMPAMWTRTMGQPQFVAVGTL